MQILRGRTFQDGGTLDAAGLHALVDEAIIQPDFLLSHPEKTAVAGHDQILLFDPVPHAFRRVQAQHLSITAAQHSGFSALSVRRSSAPGGTTVECAADECILRSASGAPRLVTGVTASAQLGVHGAGGVDAGVLPASSWAWIWFIAGAAAGSPVAVLLSASATSPVLPPGFHYRRLIGAAWIDASGVFRPFVQYGTRVAQARVEVALGLSEAAWAHPDSSSSVGYQAASMPAACPPSRVAMVHGTAGCAAGLTACALVLASDATGVGAQSVIVPASAAGVGPIDGLYAAASVHVPLTTAQTCYWKHGMPGPAAPVRFLCSGFTLHL